jgi:hypothetical protein
MSSEILLEVLESLVDDNDTRYVELLGDQKSYHEDEASTG